MALSQLISVLYKEHETPDEIMTLQKYVQLLGRCLIRLPSYQRVQWTLNSVHWINKSVHIKTECCILFCEPIIFTEAGRSCPSLRKYRKRKTYRSRGWFSNSSVGKALWKVKNVQKTNYDTWRILQLLCRFWRGTRILLCLT